MRNLIATADDFAAHPFIDQGIRKAVLAGCVNTVSAMMTFQDPSSKIKSLIEEASEAGKILDVGVHISLTAGAPILFDEAYTLTYEGGKFMDIMCYEYAKVDPIEVYKEVKAQVSKYRDEVGSNPKHLTCHHGIMHLFPDFFKIYLKVATEFGIPIRKPIMISMEKVKGFRFSRMRREGLFKAYKILRNLGIDQVAMNMVSLNKKNLMNTLEIFNDGIVKCPDYFIDTFYRKGKYSRLKRILKHLPRHKTSELIVHLGEGSYDDNENERKKYNGINLDNFPGRIKELNALLETPNLAELIENNLYMNWANYPA